MDRYIGKLLDNRYELQEVIGTGGMAVVYKARCHRLNRFVAVKVLKSELAQDAEFRRRFHDESQAVAMLSHPNIVAVYDVSRSDDLNYIVMELIDGITLKQYMKKKGAPLNWREALHFITQIMKALDHAHSRGIIHRDIKPHNIMVLRDGSVKVADFGIARLASASQSTLTQEALGSVHYISPEQARGSRVDARSDIYSAGVVLYEMITGRLPYEGDSPVSVAIQHINSIPLSPRELNPEIPEALEAITMKAMASNVSQRYESADAMMADLEEFRKNPSVNFDFVKENLFADSSDEPTQVVGPIRNNPEVRRRRSDEERREEKRNVWPVALAIGVIALFLVGIGYFLWTFFFSGMLEQTETVTVQSFLGWTEDAVDGYDKVLDGTFEIVNGGTISSDTYAEGQVASQDPEGNTEVKDTDASIIITIYISSGPEKVTVPTIDRTMDEQAIRNALSAVDLTPKFLDQYDDEVTAGFAISSEPESETEVTKGSIVTVYLSKGPETKTVTVENYMGMTQDDAEAKIKAAGLTLGTTVEQPSDTVEAGTVISQDVAANTQVVTGATITLTVSVGPESTDTDTSGTETGTSDGSSSTSAAGVASTQSISVDLSGYSGNVNVRITVGGVDSYDSTVNASQYKNKPFSPPVTGTGVQEVVVYVDDKAVDTLTVTFSS